MSIVGGYQDTRNNNEDIAITPYLFGVWVNKNTSMKIYGFGLCWIYSSVYIGIGFNIPKEYRGFRILKREK